MNYLHIRVFQDGRPAEGIEVAGGINHGIYAGQTDDFYTDSEGYATIEWYQNTFLDEVFIDGDSFEGEFYDGSRKVFHI